ncbi:SLC13 family permease [Desulfogranum marinum]|uniref:SLC13 family permease n=1 Tax=Desulfogranum marinum TaxID=453220 RepID=UPI00196533C6|nr:SLC13 family permease [Desulfogranum marinum]MBM9512039.1 SLC13 family permease [Desulfogranum marinum]
MIGQEMFLSLTLLTGTVFLLVTQLFRADLVGLLVVVGLMISGVLTIPEALSGFSNPVVLIVASMFIVSEAVVHTGIAQRLGEWVIQYGGKSELRLMILLMAFAGLVGSFMSSTATVAIFIPVTIAVAEKAGLNRKRLLMPLAAASLISGMMTLVATSPNIVVNNVLKEHGLEVLPFFSFTPFGVLVLILAICFMGIFGRSMLSKKATMPVGKQGRSINDLDQHYHLGQQVYLLEVQAGSPLIDRAVARIQLREKYCVNLVAIEKTVNGRPEFVTARPETVFYHNDILVVLGEEEHLDKLLKELGVKRMLRPFDPFRRKEFFQVIGAAEVMLTPDSSLIAKTLREIGFQSRFKCQVLGIRRKMEAITTDIANLPLQYGDVLLVCGAWTDILRLREKRDDYLLLTLPVDYHEVIPARKKAPLVLAILGVMISLLVLNVVPTVTAVMLTGVALVLTRCIRLESLYKIIDWQTVVLIAGILPLALALQKTGVSGAATDLLLLIFGNVGPLLLLSLLFVVTACTGLFLSNTPTAVLIAPIAVEMGLQLGVSPQACAMTVAIACSSAFVSPLGSPVNMVVCEPGGYSIKDFVRVGTPLFVLTAIVAVLLAWFIYIF